MRSFKRVAVGASVGRPMRGNLNLVHNLRTRASFTLHNAVVVDAQAKAAIIVLPRKIVALNAVDTAARMRLTLLGNWRRVP